MTTVTVQGKILTITEDSDRKNNREFINSEQIDENEIFDSIKDDDFLFM